MARRLAPLILLALLAGACSPWSRDNPLDPGRGDPRVPGGFPEDFALLDPGLFLMGSPATEPCRSAGEHRRPVSLSRGFGIQTSEVTLAQFQGRMGYSPSTTAMEPDDPVSQLSWHEAAAYCNALSTAGGLDPCYACSGAAPALTCAEAPAHSGAGIYGCPGYRLPTEAEWEYAYRAGSRTAYHNGANNPKLCVQLTAMDYNAGLIGWYLVNSDFWPHGVKERQPNAWGLYDMAGNLSEWCHDGYTEDLRQVDAVDPVAGGAGTGRRVVRGGSYASGAAMLRAASRDSRVVAARDVTVGFRCVRTVPAAVSDAAPEAALPDAGPDQTRPDTRAPGDDSKVGPVHLDGAVPKTPPSGSCTDEDNEPNNSGVTATKLYAGVHLGLEICYPGDVDQYAISVISGDSLQVKVSFAHFKGDLDAAIITPDGKVIVSRSETNDEVLTVKVGPSGVFTLGVWGHKLAMNTYSLTVLVK